MIFFVTACVIATALAGVFKVTVDSMVSSITERREDMDLHLKTDIDIINDPNKFPNNPLKIYVKNIGSCRLDQETAIVIVDGCPLDPANYTMSIFDGDTTWNTQTVLEIIVTHPTYTNLAPGDHYVKVTINGVSDSMSFRL
jgi:archaellum component FlaG (FlaF/FlaG flagellin family)